MPIGLHLCFNFERTYSGPVVWMRSDFHYLTNSGSWRMAHFMPDQIIIFRPASRIVR